MNSLSDNVNQNKNVISDNLKKKKENLYLKDCPKSVQFQNLWFGPKLFVEMMSSWELSTQVRKLVLLLSNKDKTAINSMEFDII